MSEVRQVIAQISDPDETSPGQVTFGHYILADGLLVMTDANGTPVKRAAGEMFSHALGASDDVPAIARRMTREVRRHMLGLTEVQEKFNRRIEYDTAGVV